MGCLSDTTKVNRLTLDESGPVAGESQVRHDGPDCDVRAEAGQLRWLENACHVGSEVRCRASENAVVQSASSPGCLDIHLSCTALQTMALQLNTICYIQYVYSCLTTNPLCSA